MKIALVGYGKMGKAIEEQARLRGHDVVLRVTRQNRADLQDADLQAADVAIEFTRPESAVENLRTCLRAGVPVVCGSTGWMDQREQIEQEFREARGAFLYASNFSPGVNLFFALNRHLARLMKGQPGYAVHIEETHHTAKQDAPSGTAITLAEGILQERPELRRWVKGPSTDPLELGILSHRIDPAPGTHEIYWTSPIDTIDIRHTAHSREGFALGAVLAAEFLKDKKGIFGMGDVLQM